MTDRIRSKYVLVLLILLLLAIASGGVYYSSFEYRIRTAKFNRILAEKEKIAEACLDSLRSIIEKNAGFAAVSETGLLRIMEEQDIVLLEYLDNKLIHWSGNSFDIPSSYSDTLFSKPLVFIHNGWFIPKMLSISNERIIALIRITSDYGFENDLVKNGFERSFRLSPKTEISFERNNKGFDIFGSRDEWLFSLRFPVEKEPSVYLVIPVLLWLTVLLLLLRVAWQFVCSLADNGSRMASAASSLAFSLGLYTLVLILRRPLVLYEIPLFSPYNYSLNTFVPSLGHLTLLGIVLLLPAWTFLRYFPAKIPSWGRILFARIVLGLLVAAGAAMLWVFHFIFTDLVLNSSICFEPYKVLELSGLSAAGFIALFLLAMIPMFYFIWLFRAASESGLITLGPPDLYKPGKFNISIIFSVLFALYSLIVILDLSEKKNIENKKVLAVSYSTENDPEAEHLLINLWPEISTDSNLLARMTREEIDQGDIDSITYYLQDRYFSGYWGNFNMGIVTCRDDSPLWIRSEETMVDNCFSFFTDRIKRNGQQITGTGFWFLENQGGRSYYMGQLFYDLPGNHRNGLFIELYSDIDAFQPGYSELLLDRKYRGYMKLKDLSFAKYINGNLVVRTGDFPYDKIDEAYIGGEYDYRFFNMERYKHLLYKNGNVTVMISEKRMTTSDIIISFAYLLAITLLLSAVMIMILLKPGLRNLFVFNFRQKLQIAFIAILTFSFIAVGIAVAFFSISQYQGRHLENIKEKVNSIYSELSNRLSVETELDAGWRDPSYPSLNELLIGLSNIFNTDINLYDTRGYLMATSRPEVFFRDLTSRRLNMNALINLQNLTKSEYIHTERIASLEFISAYVPFYNNDYKLLAYLNLPYFRMQSVLARDISNVIVAVINFTLLLIIVTMFIAVIISGRLTSPLRMLSEGIGSVELGKESKHLVYEGQDEISEIVKQYNHMVDQLQESARKLATSEREFAWREMAKQVAHEIKNPLTPMKLNIQQLYKSWKDGIPGFERKLENFTKNQIEYIESLSTIASAFSSFAKMPVANPVNIILTDQIKTTLELFKNVENITFRTDWPVDCTIVVNADKEHLNGIFSNLIKNAIQSIPQGKSGIIRIRVDLKGDKVVTSVEDNGSGIPEELKKNLFTPNFTTKSSGTGLGLSIVKRFAETANGRVWFESVQGRGSLFFVELPVAYTVERIG